MPQIQLHPFKKSDCSNSWYLVLIRDGWSCFRDRQDEAADQHLSSCRNAPTGISHHLSTRVLSVCISTVVRLIIAMMMMVSTENSPKIFFLSPKKIVSHLSPSLSFSSVSLLPPSLSFSSLYLLHASLSLPLTSLCFLPDSLSLLPQSALSSVWEVRLNAAVERRARYCTVPSDRNDTPRLSSPHPQMDVLKEGNPLFLCFPKEQNSQPGCVTAD